MERNKFLVFCFAFVPGAGQMYLGMMKKGLVIMGAFWAVIAIAVMLNLGVLFVFLPTFGFMLSLIPSTAPATMQISAYRWTTNSGRI